MKKLSLLFILSFSFQWPYSSLAKPPRGKQTGVTFDKALPEDISNENFPDRIESFDFPKANLLDLVKAISKLTGMNFILDPSLNNKQISIIASSPITVAEAYKAFLSALSANNYSVVKSGAFWKIQTIEKINKDNIEVYAGDYFPSTDQLITRIIKLKHISAKELSASIKWLLSQENKISTHESSNSLIISDYGSVIERVMKIIYEMDVPGLKEDVYTIEVEHASAEDLAVILRELLSLDRSSSRLRRSGARRSKTPALSPNYKASGNEARFKISHIIPDNRTNSLIVRADKKGIERARSLVKKLDVQVNLSRTGGVWVYNVLYGTAEEVYNTLMGIKPAQRTDNKSRSSYFAPSGARRGRGNTQQKSSESPLFNNVNIMADHNTNSLIISARSKYEYGRVLNVLKKIDVPRDQVFIQAIILEMIVGRGNTTDFNLAGALGSLLGAMDKADILGNAKLKKIPLAGSVLAGFLSSSIGLGSLQKSEIGPGLILGLPFMKLLEGVGVDFLQTGVSISERVPDFDELDDDDKKDIIKSAIRESQNNPLRQSLQTSFLPLVRLLRKSDNVNVLSTPQITTLDNVPAFIEVGENAPVGISSSNTVTGTSQNIDRKDITLRLEITPLINPESGTVQMDIKQKFDDFSQRPSLAKGLNEQAVSVVKRNIETQMILHDGETAVLGGLLSDKKTTNHNKVPLLGDIPFVGWLFKGSDVTTEKRNLLVFITPTIISGIKQREKSKEILDKKLEERIEFIEEYMKGKDPHEDLLGDLVPRSQAAQEKYRESIEMEPIEENTFFQRLLPKQQFKAGRQTSPKKEELETEELDREEIEEKDEYEEGMLEDGLEEEPEKDLSKIPPAVSGPSSDWGQGSESSGPSVPINEEEEFMEDPPELEESDIQFRDKDSGMDPEMDSPVEDFFIEDIPE